MKFSVALFLLTVFIVAVCGSPFRDRPSLPRPRPGNPGFPNFPGQGPFNPKPWGRNRRSPGGNIVVDQPIDGRPSVSVDAEHHVYQGEHGSVTVYGGGDMEQGGRPQGHAGIRGEIRWGGSDSAASYDARMAEVDRIRKEMKID